MQARHTGVCVPEMLSAAQQGSTKAVALVVMWVWGNGNKIGM